MSDITDLQAALKALSAELDDTVQELKCNILIDQYIDALTAQSTNTSPDISSYTINGRSVTRQDVLSMKKNVDSLEASINRILYGNVSFADFRGKNRGGTY